MTDTLTPNEIIKSKKNFSEFIENYNPPDVITTLADYPQADGKVIIKICELTQSIETLTNLLGDSLVTNLDNLPFITWFITNEKENVLNTVRTINKFSAKGFGIFVFKVFVNNDKIDVKCLLKPELKNNTGGIAKQYQQSYWQEFNKINMEKNLGWRICPKTQHWQYLPIGKKGVSIMISANTQEKLIGVDLIINYDKSIFNSLYEHKSEIEKELGGLDWINKPKNKSCKVRKTLSCDVTDKAKYKDIIEKHIELTTKFKDVISKYLN